MKPLSDLKSILHSKRANLYYLEKCRVQKKDGRVVYLTEEKAGSQYWNIPIANTTVILLGMGTSITQGAVREIASAGVLLGFCGSGGTPLIAGNEIEWFTPQSEYRPTEYLQGWIQFWMDDAKRLTVAKKFQHTRTEFLEKTWDHDRELQEKGFYTDDADVSRAMKHFRANIDNAPTVQKLLTLEAQLTKSLYKAAATRTQHDGFVRAPHGEDLANTFLTHGNYLVYGLAATTLWTLGIPHAFAVMHGKTRRGALVFDVADLVKDALILPWAFICADENAREQEFREQCLVNFTKHEVLDFLFETVKTIALEGKSL